MIPRSVDRVAIAVAVGFLTAGGVLMGGGIASATFPGANDAIAFASSCGNTEAIYSVPNGTVDAVCPGAGSPQYTQSTSGSIDSMPFFSSDGGRLYFSSSRAAFGAPFSIYSVAYPSTPSSTLITLATPPSNDNDYAPTVTADSSGGSVLDFLQCVGTSNCTLEEETLSTAGAPTESPQEISTTGTCPPPVGPLSSADGQANRPEFNPTNPNQLVYVGESPSASPDPGQENIYLLTINATPSSTSCVDVSNTPTIIPASEAYTANSTFADQDPDWSPDGTQIVFDSNRTGGDKLYEIDPANNTGAYQVWGGVNSSSQPLDPGEEVEPVYAPSDNPQGAYPKAAYPTGGSGSNPTYQPILLWVYTGGGTNVQDVDGGQMINNPTLMATFVTADYALNVNPIWQPLTLGSPLPEAPYPALLVGAGMVTLAGGLFLRRRRVAQPA